MLGFRYLKATPTTHVLHYRGGKLVVDGAGLSFWYFAPTAVIALVPVSSRDVPFMFNEVTSDFQDVTIQGELTFRIRDPKKVAALLDHTVDVQGRYRSDDPSKLSDRLIHETQILARSFMQKRPLKDALVNSDALVAEVLAGMKSSEGVALLGVELIGFSIIGIKATPEMAKALQTDAREDLLRRADEAIYARRNAAVDLERTIKENELNTEMAGGIARSLGDQPQASPRMAWEDRQLAWAVREPFVSKTSHAELVFGLLNEGDELVVESQMSSGGVIFSDGVESDFLEFNGGSIAHIKVSQQRSRLVVP